MTTVAIPDTRRTDIIDRVHHACITEGRQAYWVCTLIEESELLEAQAAEATREELKLALPELNVGSGTRADETCRETGGDGVV